MKSIISTRTFQVSWTTKHLVGSGFCTPPILILGAVYLQALGPVCVDFSVEHVLVALDWTRHNARTAAFAAEQRRNADHRNARAPLLRAPSAKRRREAMRGQLKCNYAFELGNQLISRGDNSSASAYKSTNATKMAIARYFVFAFSPFFFLPNMKYQKRQLMVRAINYNKHDDDSCVLSTPHCQRTHMPHRPDLFAAAQLSFIKRMTSLKLPGRNIHTWLQKIPMLLITFLRSDVTQTGN